ncbi:MAG: YkgJ family cysteine cluster protein [Desulfurivibrionaceae bacterium]
MTTDQQLSGTEECRRCGTCCRQGGPALHREDLPLLREGHFSRRHLVTIRSGEPAYDPLTGKIKPVEQEILKISGGSSTWSCRFYGDSRGCTIYQHRPLECRLLKCWDTRELKEMIGRNTLTRRDLLDPSDPVLGLLSAQDKQCDYQRIITLVKRLENQSGETDPLKELTGIVRADLTIRGQAQKEFSISLARELFLFGRPVFKVLAAHGFRVSEAGQEIFLHPPGGKNQESKITDS